MRKEVFYLRIGYLDLCNGISGDMFLGALIDAGVEPVFLIDVWSKLGYPEIKFEFTRVNRCGILATSVHFNLDELKVFQHPQDVLAQIETSQVSNSIKRISTDVLQLLFAAEGKIHSVASDQLHLHEIGSHDTLLDVVGVVAALEHLQISKLFVSPPPLGSGWVKSQHGLLPIPAPAVLEILRGWPVRITPEQTTELTTPTGAALIKVLGSPANDLPPFNLLSIGYGAGQRDLAVPNITRILIGHMVETGTMFEYDSVVVIECDIDDTSPEILGYLIPLFLHAGAFDANYQPSYMKKNRPGHRLTVIAPLEHLNSLIKLILRETSSLGVRWHLANRAKAPRRSTIVHTVFGPVKVKVAVLPTQDNKQSERLIPEYEECVKLAEQHGVPLIEVYNSIQGCLADK